MIPTLYEGDYVVTRRMCKRCTPGKLVVAKHPRYGILIKRVLDVNDAGALSLVGDNDAESVSTADMGWIRSADIIGPVIMRVPTPHPS